MNGGNTRLHAPRSRQLPRRPAGAIQGHPFRWLAWLLVVLMASPDAWSQHVYSVVGSGSASNDYWEFPCPMGNYNRGTRTQMFVRASELTAAGVPVSATIYSLGFNVTKTWSLDPLTDWYLRIYTTTSSNPLENNWFSGTPVAQVSPNTYQPVEGWNNRTLDAPFMWNGTDNLVIETCSNNSSWSNNASIQWTQSLSGATFSRWYTVDAAGVCGSALTSGTSGSTRSNIRFEWEGVPCTGTPTPGNTLGPSVACVGKDFTLNVANPSTDSGISYQWYASTNGGATYTTVGTNAPSYTTSLTQNTMYYCKMSCSNSGSSANSTVKTVTLPSNACTQCNYSENYATLDLRTDITNVTVGTLNNTSACKATAPGAGSLAGRYSNYAGFVTAPDLALGSTVSFSVSSTFCEVPPLPNAFQIYIDWNQDGDFNDAGEQVYSAATLTGGTHTETGSFTVPGTATLGTTRMRVVNVENQVMTNNYAETPYNVGETEDYCVTITGGSGSVKVQLRAMLEGPFVSSTNKMSDKLRAGSLSGVTYPLIPSAQPYSAAPWSYSGSETVSPAVLAVTGDNAIVDWVLIELRSKTAPGTVLHRRAALIQCDGDIVDTDGTSTVNFPGVTADNYYVAVRHRNHLGIMTATSYALSASPSLIDLSSSTTATYGTQARKSVGSRLVMWTGDVVADGSLKYTGSNNDRDPILTLMSGLATSSMKGYVNADVNMDGEAKYTGGANDRDQILTNIGSSNPTSVRNAQLP